MSGNGKALAICQSLRAMVFAMHEGVPTRPIPPAAKWLASLFTIGSSSRGLETSEFAAARKRTSDRAALAITSPSDSLRRNENDVRVASGRRCDAVTTGRKHDLLGRDRGTLVHVHLPSVDGDGVVQLGER